MAVVFVGLMAGCLEAAPTQPAPTAGVPPLEMIQQIMADVPCEAPYSGTVTTENLKRLNFTQFEDGPGGPQEMDIRGNLLLAARAGGFSTVDITDPLNPVVLGHYGDAGGMLDVKFSPDNQTALVSSRDGIDLVDVRRPDDLVQVGRWRFSDENDPASGQNGQNAHMLYTAHINDKDWVFVAPQSSTGTWILELQGTPDARTLKLVSRTSPSFPAAPHDMYAHFDPIMKRWLLYTAEIFAWNVFDITDPANPTFIVSVPNEEPSGTHSVQPAHIGDRRLVVTSTEFGTNVLKVFDATDFRTVRPIAYWTRQVGPEVYEYQHNINIVDGRLYMAHYALGFFVFDLTKLGTSPLSLQPIAHYAGSMRSTPGQAYQGGFWDIVLHNGLIYAGAFTGEHEIGLHIVGYGCIPPGDPTYTSTG